MTANVQTMFYARNLIPWHGDGNAVSPKTAEEAIRAAGLDWEVALRPLFVRYDGADGLGSGAELTGHRANVRLDTGDVLGVVGDRYTPVQNRAAFDFVDPLVQAGKLTYETGGALGAGQRIWLLGYRTELEVARGDTVRSFLLFTNTHDGSGAVRVFLTGVRVVCENTVNMALGEGRGEGLAIRHTASAAFKLTQASKALEVADKSMGETLAKWKAMAARPLTHSRVQAYFQAVVPDNPDAERNTRTENIRRELHDLFESGQGSDLPSVRGTLWAAYNAVTEYVTHIRGAQKEASARLESVWFGSGRAMIETAEAAALELLKAA